MHTQSTEQFINHKKHRSIDQITSYQRILYFKTATNGIVLQYDPLRKSTNHLHHFSCFSSIWSSMQNITRRSVV
ncbi:hypothetical protein PHAVU_001G158400 [Phaseolus vulgaris]|uniref:Uncharacterized protein n=1 Tax=Phaseolus vulgaris TaxID=3885 RepID=V7CWK5_PHAVU|nr:hypothetical protein PHAVU_001G158400g [Phaseolus vulgaris]ESW34509.1 hypothetical protein PHAVU_001G158400g [Phaseolus vulgaris]